MDYEKIIHAIIDNIVHDPDSILIRSKTSENGKDVDIVVVAEKEDTARLIGRHGSTANALREVLSIVGKTEEKHVHVKFESFDEEKED